MRVKPLTQQIKPAFLLESDNGAAGGAGASPTAPPPPKVGSAFSKMASDMKAGEIDSDPPPAEPPAAKPPAAPKPAAKPADKPKVDIPKPAVPSSVFDEPTTPALKPGEKPPADPATAEPDFEELTKGATPATRKNFERQKTHYEEKLTTAQKELETLRAQVAAYELKPDEVKTLRTEKDRLAAEHAEMQKNIELIGLERSTKFQEKFVKGRTTLVDDAAKRVTKAGGDAAKFKAALALPDGAEKYAAMEEAFGNMPPFMQNQVAAIVTQIETLDEDRAATLADASGNMRKWAEEETAAQRAEAIKAVEARQTRFNDLMPELAKGCILLRKVDPASEGAEQWNAVVDQVVAEGKDFLFNGNKFDDFAAAAVKSRAYDRLQEIFVLTRQENETLRQQVVDLSGSEPGASSGAGAGGNTPQGDEKPKSFAERVRAGLDAIGG